MKEHLARHKKLYGWLAVDLILLAAFLLSRGIRPWMNFLADRVAAPLRRGIGKLCYLADVSVMEVLCVLAVVAVVGYLAWSVAATVRSRDRRSCLWSALLGAVCMGLSVYLGFCFLWGVHYYADGFQEKAGIQTQPIAVEELEAVTRYFAAQLQATADAVPRDADGLFAADREQILTASTQLYTTVEEQFPFLAFEKRPPKAVHFSRVMSALNFTGIYCPFTGEANVNMDSPACLFPSTIAHELAHQRSVALEQECNFLAVLSCTTSEDPIFIYCGWLLGYIHLGNALYRADPARWQAVSSTLPDTVRLDIQNNNAYWKEFQDSAARKVSDTVYEGFLQSFGEEQGLKSYGLVVDLLVAYYQDAANTTT